MRYGKEFLNFGIVCFVNSRHVGNTLSTPSMRASRTLAAAKEALIQFKLLYTMYIAHYRIKADFVRPYSSAFKDKVKCSLSIQCCSLFERSKVQIPTHKPASLTRVFAVVLSSFSRYKASTLKYAHSVPFSIFPP